MVSAYQNAIHKLWDARCSVFVQTSITNEATGRSEPTEVPRHQNVLCRLSYSSISSTEPNSEANLAKQVIKLFTDKLVEIPTGSKILVTQEGKTAEFSRSGEPAIYHYHQEVILEMVKEWA